MQLQTFKGLLHFHNSQQIRIQDLLGFKIKFSQPDLDP
jgi:hypothetical protein